MSISEARMRELRERYPGFTDEEIGFVAEASGGAPTGLPITDDEKALAAIVKRYLDASGGTSKALSLALSRALSEARSHIAEPSRETNLLNASELSMYLRIYSCEQQCDLVDSFPDFVEQIIRVAQLEARAMSMLAGVHFFSAGRCDEAERDVRVERLQKLVESNYAAASFVPTMPDVES